MLMWDSLKTATGYDVQVSTWDMFATTTLDQKNVTKASLTSSQLDPVTKYYWHVRALNDGAIGDWSDTWSFTTLDPNVSVKENTMTSKITVNPIFPNPSATNPTVSFTLSEQMRLSIDILDLHGKEMFSFSEENYDAGFHSVNISIASLPSGIYFCEFKDARGGTLLKPFVIAK
jgi:hypothetical protein